MSSLSVSLACSWRAGVLMLASAARCLRRRLALHFLSLARYLLLLLLQGPATAVYVHSTFLGRCSSPCHGLTRGAFEMRPAVPASPASRHNITGPAAIVPAFCRRESSPRALINTLVPAVSSVPSVSSVSSVPSASELVTWILRACRSSQASSTGTGQGQARVRSMIIGPSCACPPKMDEDPCFSEHPPRPPRPARQCTPTCLARPRVKARAREINVDRLITSRHHCRHAILRHLPHARHALPRCHTVPPAHPEPDRHSSGSNLTTNLATTDQCQPIPVPIPVAIPVPAQPVTPPPRDTHVYSLSVCCPYHPAYPLIVALTSPHDGGLGYERACRSFFGWWGLL